MALFDLVRVQTSTTGTGPVTVGAAVDGGRTPSAAGIPNGWSGSYAIWDGAQGEVGQTVYNASSGTFTRSMSASTTGSLLNLSGAATLSLTALAADFSSLNAPVKINASSASTWILSHGLGRLPTVQVFLSSNEMIIADVATTTSQITVTHAAPQSGYVLAY